MEDSGQDRHGLVVAQSHVAGIAGPVGEGGDVRAGDERGVGRGKEEARLGNIVGLHHPLHRHRGGHGGDSR